MSTQAKVEVGFPEVPYQPEGNQGSEALIESVEFSQPR